MQRVVASRSGLGAPAGQQTQRAQTPPLPSRRSLLAIAPALAWALAAGQPPAYASENAGGVDSSTSPLVQELLKRTEEKKAERKKERLDDYYRRNFSDYFQQSTPLSGEGSENQQAIRKWLEKNTEPGLVVTAAQRQKQQQQQQQKEAP